MTAPVSVAFNPDQTRASFTHLDDLMNTSDAVEGIAAFLDRRPPR